MSYTTSIIRVPGGTKAGQFMITGSIPRSCYDAQSMRSHIYPTEDEALSSILADPFIQSTPEQQIQLSDCSFFERDRLLLSQVGKTCAVSHAGAVLFSGGRVEAKRFLGDIRSRPEYSHVPAYCVKSSGSMVRIP